MSQTLPAGSAPRDHEPAADSESSFWPYVLPMFAFLVLTALEGKLPHSETGGPHLTWYPVAYAIKLAIVSAVALACRSTWPDLKPYWPGGRSVAWAVITGLIVGASWVLLERLPYPRFGLSGTRTAFDPTLLKGLPRWGFLTVRMVGLVLLVPLIEELFWRSFLMRWLIDGDFHKVPIGRVTWPAALISSALFAAAHPEWLPAVLTGLVWAWLLQQTRSLAACVLSHAVANLFLGVYVLQTRAWELW